MVIVDKREHGYFGTTWFSIMKEVLGVNSKYKHEITYINKNSGRFCRQ